MMAKKLKTWDDIFTLRREQGSQLGSWNNEMNAEGNELDMERSSNDFNIAELLYSPGSNFFLALFGRMWKSYKIKCMLADDPLVFLLDRLNKKYFSKKK